MTHVQKPDFVFRQNGRVHLNRRGRHFSRLLAAESVGISGSNAGYTMLRGSVKGTGYPLHSLVSPSLPLPTSPCAITFQLDFLLRIVFHGLGVLSLVFLTDFSCLYVVYSTLLNVIGAVDRSRP